MFLIQRLAILDAAREGVLKELGPWGCDLLKKEESVSVYDNLILAAANVALHLKRVEMARLGQLSGRRCEECGTPTAALAGLERACEKLVQEAKALREKPPEVYRGTWAPDSC